MYTFKKLYFFFTSTVLSILIYRGYAAKRALPPCLRMADRALLVGYPRYYLPLLGKLWKHYLDVLDVHHMINAIWLLNWNSIWISQILSFKKIHIKLLCTRCQPYLPPSLCVKGAVWWWSGFPITDVLACNQINSIACKVGDYWEIIIDRCSKA